MCSLILFHHFAFICKHSHSILASSGVHLYIYLQLQIEMLSVLQHLLQLANMERLQQGTWSVLLDLVLNTSEHGSPPSTNSL